MTSKTANHPVKSTDATLSKKEKGNKKDERSEMTEEDKKLQDDLLLCLTRLEENNADLALPALEMLKTLIRASTTSMTSVPKPLKFMRPQYARLKTIFSKMPENKAKKMCGDIISVLAMCSDEKSDCLNYRLLGNLEPIEDWGHEYVRHLTLEIGVEWKCGDKARKDSMVQLVQDIVKYYLKHNAEVEACDLLLEIERLDILVDAVEKDSHERVCMYMLSSSPLSPDPDNQLMIKCAMNIYAKFGQEYNALRSAIMLNDPELILKKFASEDPFVWRQMAILLGRHQIFVEKQEIPEFIQDLNNNSQLCRYFRSLARELDIMEPKTPEGIYKTHLETTRPFATATTPDNSRMHVAASFVNGFVNCGFGVDKILQDKDSANKFFYKNREINIMTSVASLGLIHRWDVEYGLSQVERFLYASDDFVRAGSLLAIGIINAGVQDVCDPASAILMDFIHSDRQIMRLGAVFGLGLAYTNSKRQTVTKDEEGGVIYELRKVLADARPSTTSEVKGTAGLSLGLILIGTGDATVAADMVTMLMERTDIELANRNWGYIGLGIALIFMGTQQRSEVIVETLRTLPEPFGSMLSTLVDVCAYAGTGNVLKIQGLLHICSKHHKKEVPTEKKPVEKKDDKVTGDKKADPKVNKPDLSIQQVVAVLGIGLIAMGEDVGCQMAVRMYAHIMRYGEPAIRRAVPLGLALLSISNPQLNILETLSKYSHDSDQDTAHNAIFALGLVGAGSNNARLVTMLRQLASFHYRDQTSVMFIRIAQSLVHMGKGTMTLSPFHSDRQMMCLSSVGALMTTCFSLLYNDILKNNQDYILYSLSLAIQPRMLITLISDEKDTEKLKQVNVLVRVGQAVDVIAQAGKPKTITGFQTHTTPVLLAHGERAELATDEYIALSPYLEGLVILKKNPSPSK